MCNCPFLMSKLIFRHLLAILVYSAYNESMPGSYGIVININLFINFNTSHQCTGATVYLHDIELGDRKVLWHQLCREKTDPFRIQEKKRSAASMLLPSWSLNHLTTQQKRTELDQRFLQSFHAVSALQHCFSVLYGVFHWSIVFVPSPLWTHAPELALNHLPQFGPLGSAPTHSLYL